MKYLWILCVVVALTACSSQAIKPLPLTPIKSDVRVVKQWSVNFHHSLSEYFHQFRLSVDNRAVYAALPHGLVTSLDKKNGKTLWKHQLDSGVSTGVATDEQHVYVADKRGMLWALAKQNGAVKWSVQLSSEMVVVPSIQYNHLIAQTVDGTVVSIDTQTGQKRWTYSFSVPELSIWGAGEARFFGQYIVLGLSNGKVVILDLTNGNVQAQIRVSDAKGITEIERLVDIDSTPVLIENILYSIGINGHMQALNLSTGETLWKKDDKSYLALTHGYGNVYVAATNSELTAYEQARGGTTWKNTQLLHRGINAPTIVNAYLMVADTEGYVHILAQLDGRIVGRFRASGGRVCLCTNNKLRGVKKLQQGIESITTTLVADQNNLYVLADNGSLVMYQLTETKSR